MSDHDVLTEPAPADVRGRLEGQVALVTGAGRGIGRSIALAIAEAGASVALAARSADQLEVVAAEIEAASGTALAIAADVTAAGAPEALVEQVENELGPLNVVVSAAGVSPVYTGAEKISAEHLDLILATNLRAPFLLAQAAGRRMLERGSGSIVNIASIGGVVGLNRLAAYSAAKAGLIGMTRVMAVEWASRGVRVNAVAPAYASTEMADALLQHESIGPMLLGMTPIGRFAEAREIAPAVVFLASSDASYITGQTICVDGGWTAQ